MSDKTPTNDTSGHSRVTFDAPITAPKTKKKKVRLTATNANTLQHEVQINLVKHVLAAKHFEVNQFWLFSLPQAVLTAIASILAFIGGSASIADDSKSGELGMSTKINLIVGSFSAIAVLFQTVSGFKGYDKRADRHANTAIQLRDLRDQLKILVIKLKSKEVQDDKEVDMRMTIRKSSLRYVDEDLLEAQVEAEVAKERAAEQAEDDELVEGFDLIQKKFQQCLAGCTSYVPLQLGECFHGLQSNLELKMTKANRDLMELRYGEHFDECLLISKAIDMLAANILEYPFFPMDIPNPKSMIIKTMDELEERIMEMDKPFAKGQEGSEKRSMNDSMILPPVGSKDTDV